MSDSAKTSTCTNAAFSWPLVVGTVYSAESLRAAAAVREQTGGPDLIELRVDHFAEQPEALESLTDDPPRLFIVTVRHPHEGGAGDLSDGEREELFGRFERHARLIDVEIGSLEALDGVVRRARARGCGVIASFHDFVGMPTLAGLRAQAGRAAAAGVQVLKVAAMVRTAADLAVLLDFIEEERRLPLALMGMGALGRVSRLTLAATGSVLNYGYIGASPQIIGQWPAAVLRQRIDELLSAPQPSGGVESAILGLIRRTVPVEGRSLSSAGDSRS